MAVKAFRLGQPAEPIEPRRERPQPAVRSISGPGKPPPGSMELPLEEPARLWLAIHLADAALLESVATHCYRFTSLVSLEPPDGVLLELQGSLRLFGGPRALLRRIATELKERGMEVKLAAAPTPTASLWLSRCSNACVSQQHLAHRLATLPVACLRWPEEQTKLLDSFGVRTLGDLMRLPRAGLARRLGAKWAGALDSALGRRSDPRAGFQPEERYRDAFEPEAPVTDTQWLEALIVSRLELLQEFLRSRQAAIGTLSFRLRHRKCPATRVRIAFAAPVAEVTPLTHLLHERLSAVRLPSPVMGVRVRSGPLFSLEAASGSLMRKMDARFQGEAAALPRLVERLRARLGMEAVCGIRTARDHRPERAWRGVDPLSAAENTAPPASLFGRPVWLGAQPLSLTTEARARLVLEHGPERIESGWWDGADVARDYFVARQPDGAKVWVYRERHEPHGWYVHGYFG